MSCNKLLLMRTVYACTAQSKCIIFFSVRGDCPKILVGKQTSKEEARCRWDSNIKMLQEDADDKSGFNWLRSGSNGSVVPIDEGDVSFSKLHPV
jgi:hypothetical protein